MLSETEKAGWLALFIGLLVGVMIGAYIGSPDCYEDEVVMWTGTEHTECVPLDEL